MPEKTNPSSDEFLSAGKDINVEEIMDSIKKRIQEKKDSGVLRQIEIDEIENMELLPLPDFLEVPNVYQPHLYPGASDTERQQALDAFQPEQPHFEQEEGSGIRGLVKKILKLTRKLFFPLIRFMTRPIYNELKQITYDKTNANARNIHKNTVDRPLIHQSKEYIKLLHNTLNNMIVESSKLKIEEELLKTRIKVLEDKMKFLEDRERAIEKKLFKDKS
jgi:hypothetical protein